MAASLPPPVQTGVGAGAAPVRVDAQGAPLRRRVVADAEGGQEAAAAEVVDGGALLCEEDRVAQGQDGGVHAELQASRAAGDGGEGAERLEDGLRRDEALAEPEGVDLALLAGVDPAPEGLGAGEGEGDEAEADPDPHRPRLAHSCHSERTEDSRRARERILLR